MWGFGARRSLGILLAAAILCGLSVSASAGTAYLDSLEEPELNALLLDNFTLPMLLEIPEGSDDALAEEIAAEVSRLTGLLRRLGYLEARIETSGTGTQKDPLRLSPIPGEVFQIGSIRVIGLAGITHELAQELTGFIDNRIGEVASEDMLQGIVQRLKFELREAAYGKAVVDRPELMIDHTANTADVVVSVDLGPILSMGEVTFDGSFRVEGSELQALVPFKTGQAYRGTYIEELKSTLEESGLFRRVRVEQEDGPGHSNRVDIAVELRDAAPNPTQLARDGGVGAPRLILTMLMIVLLECVRRTSYWSHRSVRVSLYVPVILMAGFSSQIVLQRLFSFLI